MRYEKVQALQQKKYLLTPLKIVINFVAGAGYNPEPATGREELPKKKGVSDRKNSKNCFSGQS
jgi:hypothetical protein